MANDMLLKASFLLSVVPLTLTTDEQIVCSKNSTILETTGDAILTVFVDANYGQYCNISSVKGLQQISTALHVVRTLNKYDYVPGVKLGLRFLDTCQDGITVFRQALRTAVERNCAPDYEMGVLVPFQYGPTVDSLRYYGGLLINTYGERNFTEPTIDILAHYLSTRHEIVDLVLANANHILDRFLKITRNAGVCVKRHDKHVNDNKDTNVTEAVIIAIGDGSDIQQWLRESEKSKDSKKTWLLLPLDNPDIDDLIPSGSYIIKPETPFSDFGEFSNMDEFLENTTNFANYSPYLIGIGGAVVELADVLQDIQKGNWSIDDEESCVASQFHPESRREIRDSDVYKALHIQPKSHSVKYVVATKTQHGLVNVAFYKIEMSKLRVHPERIISEMPGLCLGNLVGNCENCTNFRGRSDTPVIAKDKTDVTGRSVLKNTVYVPIFLIAIVCGTLACCVIVIFIVRRFATDEMLDGNPTLTIVLILANMFTLLTTLPFCMTDDYFGTENLNARYDMFLLLALFVACCFITQVQRNYREGKFFFGTAISLLVVWAIWLICFVLMQPENRDTIVSFGTIGTAYSIIFGVLIPRVYYMTTHPLRSKNPGQRFDPIDISPDSIVNTIIRQSRYSYDNVYPAHESQVPRTPPTCLDYYGNPSPGSKYHDRWRSANHREMPGYSNYGFQTEMKEIDSAHVAPRTRIENKESLRNLEVAPNDVIYTQPKIYRSQRIVLGENSNIKSTCNRHNLSPITKPHHEMYPIRYASPINIARTERINEEDEDEDENDEEYREDQEDEDASRVTRF
ncbi:uncharacterized protein boss isoform X4 [Linepithema humile]|uniref:uncharacterized protein boss isoform X4 n=1 Tax=Linepithema humile TaxID=83485 RepID=UPI00351DB351